MSTSKRFLALLTIAALTACGGGGSALPNSALSALPARHAARADSILTSIVGVGDSLTAGYQSNGFLGETGVTAPVSGNELRVPQGQENGFWADLWEQASSLPLEQAIAKVYDPSTSPLPLIKGPGLNNQIIHFTNLDPIVEQKSGNICTDNHSFNEAAYHLKGITRVRMDPTSTNIRDVGVPGMTLHEANVLHQPQSDTCQQLPGIEGLLNLVVADESGTFWPVLGNFTKLGGNLTDVNAAASQHPTLATVWLGANDVLKYMGSGGRFHGGDDSAGQAEGDVRAAVSTLQRAGAKVVVANLPNILRVGYFQRVTNPTKYAQCEIQTYAWCVLSLLNIYNTKAVVTAIANQYHLSTPGGCVPASLTKPCGYLTLQGSIEIVQYEFAYSAVPDLDCANPAPHCKAVAGSGLGNYYITPAFAAKIQALNNVINTGINDAAANAHVPLVDVTSIFDGIASGDPSNPYFKLAASIDPKYKCCTLGYFYGLLSFDGLHPSNTGYALIAYAFIDAINKAYGTKIPQIDVKAVYDGTRCSNTTYCYPDPYAPPHDIPG
jgi:lysophospholipase L1-like esterase